MSSVPFECSHECSLGYACPEPVLAKQSLIMLRNKWTKRLSLVVFFLAERTWDCTRSTWRFSTTPLPKTHLFFSSFPMSVPSLSWQNDRFCTKMAQKRRFSLAPIVLADPVHSRLDQTLRRYPLQKGYVVFSVSYACPEPVLANIRGFLIAMPF